MLMIRSRKLVYSFAHLLRSWGVKFNEENDPRVQEMKSTIGALKNGAINLNVEQYPDGSWSAEATNLEGLITGGRDVTEAPELIKDAIFTYFEIPPHLANDRLLRSDNEPKTVEQRIHVGA